MELGTNEAVRNCVAANLRYLSIVHTRTQVRILQKTGITSLKMRKFSDSIKLAYCESKGEKIIDHCSNIQRVFKKPFIYKFIKQLVPHSFMKYAL
jgi:hypothetical protein